MTDTSTSKRKAGNLFRNVNHVVGNGINLLYGIRYLTSGSLLVYYSSCKGMFRTEVALY